MRAQAAAEIAETQKITTTRNDEKKLSLLSAKKEINN
jgi:hypothetical protein